MNLKLFYLIKACPTLPTELIEQIWGNVRDSAVDLIRDIYILRVARNMDIFVKLINIINNIRDCGGIDGRRRVYHNKLYSYYNYNFINKFIKLNMNKIAYNYIQEPGTWIQYLNNIINNYSDERYFHINNVNCIINNIKNSNEMYINTRITWWEFM